MVLSNNVKGEVQAEIESIWRCTTSQQYDKYLGLPSIIGRSRKKAIMEIKTRLWKCLQTWKERLLSQDGWEVLIKVVALAIPMFTMSCFKLPTTLCLEFESLMANFWWGKKERENKIQWIELNKMCSSKAKGGMGFRKLSTFNLTLLAKQGWRIFQDE